VTPNRYDPPIPFPFCGEGFQFLVADWVVLIYLQTDSQVSAVSLGIKDLLTILVNIQSLPVLFSFAVRI
jgi:hypothetical protein